MPVEVEEDRRSVLAAIGPLDQDLELSERDHDAAQAVAAVLRDAKAPNTHRAYESAWQAFQAWADAGGHRSLPACSGAPAGAHGICGSRPGPGHRRPGNYRSDGRRRSQTVGSFSFDVERRRDLVGRHGTYHHPQGQKPAGAGDGGRHRDNGPRPRCSSTTPFPSQPVFGMTGETLANRIRAQLEWQDWAGVSVDTAAASAWPGG